MRYLLLACFALIATSAHATPITKDMANNYYGSCMAKTTEGMSAESQKLLCACTAANMMNNMSVEDVKAMAQQDQNGRNATNKMVVDVYAPCIEYPAKEYYYNTCISNPQTAQMSKNPQGLCTCLGNEMASYLKANSRAVFQDLLMRNPAMVDPMSALTSDPKFQQFAQNKLLGCVR